MWVSVVFGEGALGTWTTVCKGIEKGENAYLKFRLGVGDNAIEHVG
jgi:hypothetical protein